MKHPLDFIPSANRKPIFFVFLAWFIFMTIVMQLVSAPLKTPDAPLGIVSFELAGTPERAFQVAFSWSAPLVGPIPWLYAAFSLGLDYLYMPSYALVIALGVLLAFERHKRWFVTLGIWIGWGSLLAMIFDATENIALLNILVGDFTAMQGWFWPQIAFWCATLKFALIGLGVVYALVGGILPKSK